MSLRFLLLCLLSGVFLAQAGAQTRRAEPVEVDRIIAVVNDEAITAFERTFEGRAARLSDPVAMPNWESAARDLLDTAVVQARRPNGRANGASTAPWWSWLWRSP
jgi:hypothetical protein